MTSRTGSDAGLGLIEVFVALSLLGLAITIFGLAYSAANRTATKSQEMGAGTDEVRLALAELDAQVRSGYWVKSATVSCRDSTNTTYSCPAVKVLTISRSSPTARVCWVWRVAPWPRSPGGGPPTDEDPTHRKGLLQSFHYDAASSPGGVSSWDWYTEASGIDYFATVATGAEGFTVTGSFKALNFSNLTYVTYYTGIVATLQVAQDDVRRLPTYLQVSVRNQRIGAQYSSECPLP